MDLLREALQTLRDNGRGEEATQIIDMIREEALSESTIRKLDTVLGTSPMSISSRGSFFDDKASTSSVDTSRLPELSDFYSRKLDDKAARGGGSRDGVGR